MRMRDKKTGLLVQTGALPWRSGSRGRVEVLLVTGRRSGRWLIPKGWPMPGKSLAAAAAQEAFEEAGVEGRLDPRPLGAFTHYKQHMIMGGFNVQILVHSLRVERELARWPEHGQRKRKWFDLEQAAGAVDSEPLAGIIAAMGTKRVRKGFD